MVSDESAQWSHQTAWLRNVADAGRDGLKGQRRQEGEAVIDENPEPQALEGWTGRLTPSQSHTHTHAFCQRSSPENTLGTLWSRRHLENDSRGGRETSIPINVHSWTDPGLTSARTAARVFGEGALLKLLVLMWKSSAALRSGDTK